jgi:hypothetical protein
MDRKKMCRYWVAMGIIFIVIYRSIIRPGLNDIPYLTTLLGVVPNFLGAFLLPIGGYLFFDKYINLAKPKTLFFFCFSCFILLISNELLQRIPIFKRTFDYYDIFASGIGLLISCVYCNFFIFKKITILSK